ncbi:unnamed protein product [Dibothriocephalus latus]|uniref:Trematode PH-like domain-containing protein n=1 Tax=Dibothriocephalus latus TaxID=60516 RepID=A0A3P6UZJ8_DIBLA|nr:unnamed protein product [Dibothriocephalus latus]
MATLKPIGTDKKKAPLYFEDTVQIYGPIPRNAKAPFNPQDAQKGLKKLLEGKKSIKAKMVAGETGLGLKKKGIGGKKPPMEKMPYTGVKGFYQFSDNPGCVVVAVETKEIKPQYVIFAPTTVEKAVRLVKVFQAAQWAEKSNLKNKPAPLPEIDNSAAVASSRRSSEVLSRRSPTDFKHKLSQQQKNCGDSKRTSTEESFRIFIFIVFSQI